MVTATPRIKPSRTGMANLHRRPKCAPCNAPRQRSFRAARCSESVTHEKSPSGRCLTGKPSGTANFRATQALLSQSQSASRNMNRGSAMAQARAANQDFTRSFGEAKKHASDLADQASSAAQDLYEDARDKAADLADSANDAAWQTAGSFERALRNTIETQPYTAVAIAL